MSRRRRSDDPAEVIALAASSLRLIGGIMLLIAIFSVMWAALLARHVRVEWWIRVAAYVLPGIAFLLVAPFVARRHVWAAVVALMLTGAITLVWGLVTVSLLVLITIGYWDATWATIVLIPTALFTFATGILTYHLTKTFDAMRRIEPAEQQRAFEPLIVTSQLPPGAHNALPPAE